MQEPFHNEAVTELTASNYSRNDTKELHQSNSQPQASTCTSTNCTTVTEELGFIEPFMCRQHTRSFSYLYILFNLKKQPFPHIVII